MEVDSSSRLANQQVKGVRGTCVYAAQVKVHTRGTGTTLMMQKNTCPAQQHTINFNQSIKYVTIMFLFLFLSGCFFIKFLSSFNAMINDQLVSISKKRIKHTWMAAVVYSLFSLPGVAAPCTLFSFPLVSSSSLLLLLLLVLISIRRSQSSDSGFQRRLSIVPKMRLVRG